MITTNIEKAKELMEKVLIAIYSLNINILNHFRVAIGTAKIVFVPMKAFTKWPSET